MMILYDEFMKINEEAKKEYEQNRAAKEKNFADFINNYNEAMRNGNFSFDSGADNGDDNEKERINEAWDSILRRNAEKHSEALDALGKGPGEEVHFSDSESTESNGSKKD